MVQQTELRPLERRVLRMADDGVDDVEIAWRFRRSPRFVRQVRELARLERTPAIPPTDTLRPIERRVLKWREQGVSHGDMAARFRRSPAFLEQVERLARHKLTRAG